jgi:hypothetical protein
VNALGLIIIGAYLLVVSVKGRQRELIELLQSETGFVWWLLAVAIVWLLVTEIVPKKYHSLAVATIAAMMVLGNARLGGIMLEVEKLTEQIERGVKNG